MFDLGCHTSIKKIIYLKFTEQYYVIENQTCAIKIFDKKFEYIDSIVLQASNNKSTIVDFSIDKENCIIGCIFEESLFFCNIKLRAAKNFVNQENSISYKHYNKIEYFPKHEMWAITSKSGEIQLATVSYNSRTFMTFRTINTLNYHESMIT